MRIFLSSLIQESNTFSNCNSNIEMFRNGYIYRGEEVRQGLNNTNTEVCGFLEYFNGKQNIELALGYFAWAVAAGPLIHQDFINMLDQIIAALTSALPVDGVLLAFHGALVSTEEFDCEGYALERIRRIVGRDIPISCSFDYHANITKRMIDNCDVLVGYRTFPHVDFKETGIRAAKNLEHIINNNVKIHRIFRKYPIIVPCEDATTDVGVAKMITDEIRRLERENVATAAAFFCMHPLLDIYEVGNSIVIYTDDINMVNKLNQKADELGTYMMKNKESFFVKYDSIEYVMKEIDNCDRPIILIDSGDVLTGGAVGDSTVMIRSFLKDKRRLKCVVNIVDEKIVAQTRGMHEGDYAYFEFGNSNHPEDYNAKVTAFGQYLRHSDSLVTFKGESFCGLKMNPGRRVLICMNETIFVIACEYPTMLYDPEVLRSIGIEPADMDIIVQKAHNLFKPAYKKIARTIINVDTQGITNQNIKKRNYKYIQHPVYPFDEVDTNAT